MTKSSAPRTQFVRTGPAVRPELYIVGMDLNPNLVKASKMNMVMNNDGAGGLFQANSVEAARDVG